MNINKKINKIEKEVANKIDELVLKNLEELNEKVYEYYRPYLAEMDELLMTVYSHPYMSMNMFESYIERLLEISKPFNKDTRDDILLKFSEEVLVKNREVLYNSLEGMLKAFADQRLPINEHKVRLEWKKMENTAVSRMSRFFNENYRELCAEFSAVCAFTHDSLMDYLKSPRVYVDDEDDDIRVEIEIEPVSNNRLIKTDNVYDIIELAVSNGFKKVRQHGSHCIYKHSNGQILVIPVHGKAINSELSYGIQKQIYNKVA